MDRPNRQRCRRRGKSDPQDAISAARAAQGGDATGRAKTRDGNVEAMRVLRVARNSARRSRTQALNQMRALISTAPDEIRSELRHLDAHHLLRRASSYRPGQRRDVHALTRFTLRTLARRAVALETEVDEIDKILTDLVAETAPELVAIDGVGTDVATTLLVAAGDNPERLHSEATFAHLCGVARSTPPAANTNDTATVAATAKPIPRSGTSSSPEWSATNAPAPTSTVDSNKDAPRKKPSAASSATSPARSTPIDVVYTDDYEGPFPTSTLLMRKLGPSDGWFVLAGVTEDVTITTPESRATIPPGPLTVEGIGTGHETTIHVKAFPAGNADPLLDETFTSGGLYEPAPYAATLDLTSAPAGFTAIMASGDSGLSVYAQPFTVIPVNVGLPGTR